MFSKSKTPDPVQSTVPQPRSMQGAQSSFSVLAADVVITGNISATVDLHLDGRVEGDVACATLVQGQGGLIRGAITAEVARISGTVEGSITVKELIVEASARITGDVNYEKLTIAQGGQVDGRLSHRTAAAVAKVELVASN